MAKLVDEGENRFLNILLGATAVDANLYMGLYTNGSEPAETATLASLTEVTGSGYARKTLARGSWTIDADLASFAEQSFGPAGASWGNVTGYFIATSSDNTGKLLFVESFSDGAYPIGSGSSLAITPKVTAA